MFWQAWGRRGGGGCRVGGRGVLKATEGAWCMVCEQCSWKGVKKSGKKRNSRGSNTWWRWKPSVFEYGWLSRLRYTNHSMTEDLQGGGGEMSPFLYPSNHTQNESCDRGLITLNPRWRGVQIESVLSVLAIGSNVPLTTNWKMNQNSVWFLLALNGPKHETLYIWFRLWNKYTFL